MIRIVTIDDASAITSIYNEYIKNSTATFEIKTISTEEMQQRITEISSEFPYLVDERDGKIAGYCYAHKWKERAAYRHTIETSIYLSKQYQGKGIGTELMNALIKSCRVQGYHTAIACITAENKESCAFHERLGFKKVSHFKEVGMKFGQWLDIVDYELIL